MSECGLGVSPSGAPRINDHTVKPLPKIDKAIGLDMGITSLIATSNGDKIANPKHFKQLRQENKNAASGAPFQAKGKKQKI